MPDNIENTSEDHLHWFQRSKARDGLYETPKEIADIIYESVKHLAKKDKSLILDPCAGRGRLLKPFKKDGYKVLGIEYNEDVARGLKRNIGKKFSRSGNILDYKNNIADKFNFVIANPPFGLQWDVEDFYFDLERNDKIESQSAVVEIINNSLLVCGVGVIILPTSTWTNAKDRHLRDYIYNHFDVRACITVDNAFKKEYGIDVQTDIVYLQRNSYRYNRPETFRENIDIKELIKIPEIIRNIYFSDVPESKKFSEIELIPEYSKLTEYKDPHNSISISKKGVVGSSILMSLLDFYDASGVQSYNSVIGNLTGVKEAYLSMPSLIRNGFEPTVEFCKNIGIPLEFNETQISEFKKLQKKWEDIAIPIYRPKAHELLAYFKYGRYTAKANLYQKNVLVFKKGNKYLIKPSWVRFSNEVERKEVEKSDGKKTGEVKITSIESGYLELIVESEVSELRFPENNSELIDEFLKAFDLPDVKGIADVFPERVKNWSNVIAKRFPYLYPFQAEDLSRVLCKDNVYLGYEMGAGKTVTALSYANARKFGRVLVICQGSLIENWLFEAKKFGLKATVIRTNTDIWRLKKRIKCRDFKRHETEIFVIGQEFLSLDGGRVFNPWSCEKYDKDGNVIHSHHNITKGSCKKNHKYETIMKTCQNIDCGATYDEGWTGKYCNKCGYTAYTYGTMSTKPLGYKNFIKKADNKPITLKFLEELDKEEKQIGMRQYPAFKSLKKLFKCIITDESQNFANRSLRGEASRAMRSKSRLMLSGTIMKNYVKDVFLNFGWLLNYDNPIYYFGRGDIKRFLDEFGSYEVLSYDFLSEYKNAAVKNRKQGSKKLLPEVSNLNRFWRIISPFTVRKTTKDIEELRSIEREREVLYLPMDSEHYNIYQEYYEWARELIERELRKPDEEINLGVISNCLWKLRFVASVPNTSQLIKEDSSSTNYPNVRLEKDNWNKIDKLIEILTEKKAKGEKSIVFSGLRSLQGHTARYLQEKGFRVKFINATTKTCNRLAEINDFSDNGYDVLVTGSNVLNRGYTIISANNVIFMDVQYTPEITDQAEARVIRPGQNKKVSIYYLLSEETIDQEMIELCDLKRKAIVNAIDKKAVYSDIKDLLNQADKRNPELAIANKIHKKNVVMKKKRVIVQYVKPEMPVDNYEEMEKMIKEKIIKDTAIPIEIIESEIILGANEQYVLFD